MTEAGRRRPYCVVLFDESEKAHPDVFNIFLQLFDDGRLTDGQGRTVNFTNTVIIMTSNIASDLIKQMGADADQGVQRSMIMSELDKHLRPEFLNRLDEIIIFHSLTRENITRIVDIQLRNLEKILSDRRITIEMTTDAKILLADLGWDPVFGARPLKRAIQRHVQDPLAMAILEGNIHEGDHVRIDVSDDGESFIFESVSFAPADA